MLGERLFPVIQNMHPDLAGKITGMLLEIDNTELLHMLESRESLKAKVSASKRHSSFHSLSFRSRLKKPSLFYKLIKPSKYLQLNKLLPTQLIRKENTHAIFSFVIILFLSSIKTDLIKHIHIYSYIACLLSLFSHLFVR